MLLNLLHWLLRAKFEVVTVACLSCCSLTYCVVNITPPLVTQCFLAQNPDAARFTHNRTMGQGNLILKPHLAQTQLIAVNAIGVIRCGLEVLWNNFTGFQWLTIDVASDIFSCRVIDSIKVWIEMQAKLTKCGILQNHKLYQERT